MASNDMADRISSLPDKVLCHILSFLPTKYSLRTSLLSTRWKHLFTFVPILDLDFNSGSPIKFIDFVSYVFNLYNVSQMNKFTLCFWIYGELPDNYPICHWISSAILRGVQHIDINIHYLSSARVTMPHHLFSSETLTTLQLRGYTNFVLPGLVCLPCLKTCVLSRVCFDDESAKRLFGSCPALEDLELVHCHVAEGVKLLDISSPNLKHLIIVELPQSKNNYQLVLDVPNLLRFQYIGPAMLEFIGLESLKTVIDAWIYYKSDTYSKDDVAMELVHAFSHVPKLELSCETIEAFIRSGHSLPSFNNLTRLNFYPISSRSWMLLPSLLDNTPQLEFLSLYQAVDEDPDKSDSYIVTDRVPACVALHLKEVEFRYFFTLDYDLKLINYFLKYAKNLKKMQITSNLTWDEQVNEQFEISSAKIVFHWDGEEYL